MYFRQKIFSFYPVFIIYAPLCMLFTVHYTYNLHFSPQELFSVVDSVFRQSSEMGRHEQPQEQLCGQGRLPKKINTTAVFWNGGGG